MEKPNECLMARGHWAYLFLFVNGFCPDVVVCLLVVEPLLLLLFSLFLSLSLSISLLHLCQLFSAALLRLSEALQA